MAWPGADPSGVSSRKHWIAGPALFPSPAVGLIGGAVSSLIGLGSAFYSVPFMTRFIAMQKAIGTAATLNIPLAIGGVLGYIAGDPPSGCGAGCLGYLYLPAVGPVGITAVLAAPLGARLAHVLPVLFLRRLFAVLLLVSAGNLAIKTLPLAEAPAYAAKLIARLSAPAAAQAPIAAAPPACLENPDARIAGLVAQYGPRLLFKPFDDCLPPQIILAVRSMLRVRTQPAPAFWSRPIPRNIPEPSVAAPPVKTDIDRPRPKRRERMQPELPSRNPDRLIRRTSGRTRSCVAGAARPSGTGSGREHRCPDATLSAPAERVPDSPFDPFGFLTAPGPVEKPNTASNPRGAGL